MLGYSAIQQLLQNKRKQDVEDEVYQAKREFQKALTYEAAKANKRKSAEQESELDEAVVEFQEALSYASAKLANNPQLKQAGIGAVLSPSSLMTGGFTIGTVLALMLGRENYINQKQRREDEEAARMMGTLRAPSDVLDYLSEEELTKEPTAFSVAEDSPSKNISLVER